MKTSARHDSAQSKQRRPLFFFLYGLMWVVIAVFIVEVFLRHHGTIAAESVHGAGDPVFDNIPGTFEPKQRVTIRPRPELTHTVSINSLGFRGREISMKKTPGTIRILAIGDSLTYGDFVNEEGTMPYLLEQSLNNEGMSAEVVNAGVGGTTILDQAVFLKKALAINPDMVLLTFAENDIVDLHKEVPVHKRMESNRKLKTGMLGPLITAMRDTALFNFVLYAKGWYADRRPGRAAAEGPAGGDGETDRVWAIYETELQKMAAALNDNGIPLVLVYFPSHLSIGDPLHVKGRLERFRGIAERAGIETIELVVPLEQSGLTKTELFLLPHDGHPSPRAYAIASRVIVSHLRQHILPRVHVEQVRAPQGTTAS